jgi:hypothetical protein
VAASSLNAIARGIEAAGKQRQKEHKAFNNKLGEPAVFVPDEEDGRFGIGYWKGDHGVFSYRRYSNGYDPNTRHEYPKEMIDILNKVLKGGSMKR